MQDDLDKLNQWSSDWLMRYNADTCKVMHLGTRNKNYDYLLKTTPPNGAEASQEKILETTNVEKALSVHVDNQLKFRSHTNTVVAKSNKIIGIMK